MPLFPASAACACISACPVPSWGSWTTVPTAGKAVRVARTVSAMWPTTTVDVTGWKWLAVRRMRTIIGSPPTAWSTLGSSDFIRVPLPAARVTKWSGVGMVVKQDSSPDGRRGRDYGRDDSGVVPTLPRSAAA